MLTSISLSSGLLLCSFFFFSSRRRHTRFDCDWSSDVCSSDLVHGRAEHAPIVPVRVGLAGWLGPAESADRQGAVLDDRDSSASDPAAVREGEDEVGVADDEGLAARAVGAVRGAEVEEAVTAGLQDGGHEPAEVRAAPPG